MKGFHNPKNVELIREFKKTYGQHMPLFVLRNELFSNSEKYNVLSDVLKKSRKIWPTKIIQKNEDQILLAKMKIVHLLPMVGLPKDLFV